MAIRNHHCHIIHDFVVKTFPLLFLLITLVFILFFYHDEFGGNDKCNGQCHDVVDSRSTLLGLRDSEQT